jgi:hypothetical protein
VLLDAADIAAAAAALGMAEGEFIAAHATLARNRAQLTLKESPGGACEFLDSGGNCRIYAARPGQCRDFPGGWRVAGCPGGDEFFKRPEGKTKGPIATSAEPGSALFLQGSGDDAAEE